MKKYAWLRAHHLYKFELGGYNAYLNIPYVFNPEICGIDATRWMRTIKSISYRVKLYRLYD